MIVEEMRGLAARRPVEPVSSDDAGSTPASSTVEKSPSSERSRGHRPHIAESSDEVGFMIGDLTSRRTSPLPCDWCDKPAVVKFWGNWCGWHALVEIGPFPWFEWLRKWDA
jgi:hypothetical protein